MPLTRSKLTQWPVYHPPEEYELAIKTMTNILKPVSEVLSIYQVGGISDYGISDIDMLVVFKDGGSFKDNPISMSGKLVNRYLFTHRLFGTTENRLNNLENFTRFGTYNFLNGKQQIFKLCLSSKDLRIIETQIALEYMLKAFISLHTAICYGQIKVRNLLLHVKALRLDLQLLNISSGVFFEIVHELIALRKVWFQKTPDPDSLNKKIDTLYSEFKNLMGELLRTYPFYVINSDVATVSKNIKLVNESTFIYPSTKIPGWIKLLTPEKKRESILNRLFKFHFGIPVKSSNIPDVILQRHHYIKTGIENNLMHYPNFLCTAYGLDIFNHKKSA